MFLASSDERTLSDQNTSESQSIRFIRTVTESLRRLIAGGEREKLEHAQVTPQCAPCTSEKREFQEDYRVRSAKLDFDGIIRS